MDERPYVRSRGRVLTDVSGDALGTASNPVAISAASGSGGVTEYTEDAAAAANPVGGAVILVRRDTLTTAEVSADGDNVAAKANSRGQMHVDAAGGIAHDAVDAGNPIKIGGYASDVKPTAVSTADRVNTWHSPIGSIGVHGYSGAVADFANLNLTYFLESSGATFPLAVTNFVSDGANTLYQRGNTKGTFMVARPDTSGGLTSSRIVTGTTGFIKASAGQVYRVNGYNANAAIRYLQLYNKASAPTLSTDTPIATIPLAASSAFSFDIGALGLAFATGIAWAYTTDDVAIPTTAGTSTELHATVFYN